jgi:hypothetical protein
MAKNDNQRAFDVAVRQLKKQGGRSVNDDEGCVYRGPGGSMCAVGAIIADEHYCPSFEGNGVSSPDLGDKILAAVARSGYCVSRRLLKSMQVAHDISGSLEDVLIQLRKVAKRHKLNPAVIDEVA